MIKLTQIHKIEDCRFGYQYLIQHKKNGTCSISKLVQTNNGLFFYNNGVSTDFNEVKSVYEIDKDE
jgi:hypothetical protein